ncbi:MAG: hypothetical protein WAV52_00995, partial [Luteococcus japonicus]
MAERRFTLTPALRPKERPVELDEAQLRVVTHRGTPGQGNALLVAGGPGTGKTTTLVESVAARASDQDLT